MKKTILIFSSFIYFFCIIINLIDLIKKRPLFDNVFQIFFSFFCLIFLYNIFKNKYLKRSLFLLFFMNLFQSFSFIILGCTYKLIIGPDISIYFINSSDNLIQFSAKVFNFFSYFNFIKNDNTIALSINFVHLYLAMFFYMESDRFIKKRVMFQS